MSRPDTPILNSLAQVNDGRSAISGEHSGAGYLGGLGEAPVVNRQLTPQKTTRLPEKDTLNCYAFKTGVASHRLILKTKVDGK